MSQNTHSNPLPPNPLPPNSLPRGLFNDAMISALHQTGAIKASKPLLKGQIQPASMDLRLGKKCWRMRASFLPGPSRLIKAAIESFSLHEIDLTEGAVLETGCVYLAEVEESLHLPQGLSASTNPKSSTGRLDVFTRILCDQARAFDQIPEAYQGKLYAEISPRTFPVLVRSGSRLSQIRFRAGDTQLSDAAHEALHRTEKLVGEGFEAIIKGGVGLSVALKNLTKSGQIGYRAKRHTGLIDVDKIGAYAVSHFWEPLYAEEQGRLVLDPGEFYILASREAVHVPAHYAAEMVAFDPLVGEFRVHYAGFFDPGFGAAAAGGQGARAVLEVRSHDVPFIIEDGQMIGRLVYEKLAALPETLYGVSLASNYQGQGLKLSKHFKM